MKFQLPDMTIDLNVESKPNFEKIRCIKNFLIMIFAYWIDKSEISKNYYKKVYDKELEKSRLLNLRHFANPRLINFLLPTRQDGRRLNEINNSLYGALEHGIIYESNNPYACPRLLSIGHAFSHFDSILDDTAGLGNPNKAHCLLDILIFHCNKPFDEIEIAIIRTLIKSRMKLLLASDYHINIFEEDPAKNLKRLREMFLSILVIQSISEINGFSQHLSFRSHIIFFENQMKHRIKNFSKTEYLLNYDFSDFMNVFVSSIRFGGGYREADSLKLRIFLNSVPESTSNFVWIKDIIQLTDQDPFNIEYLESVVLPKFDGILTSKLEKYYDTAD